MPSTIWLIDRSRVADGRGFCARARALNNHIGPHGYGIQLKGTKIPLVGGTAYHEGLAGVLAYCRDTFTSQQAEYLIPDEVVRAAVQGAQASYDKTIEARGFSYMADQPAVAELIQEQHYLIEGLIWAWVLEVLPEVLSRGKVVEVEHDDTYVFDCTCGLGDGILSKADHEARDCQGIGLMCKPDFLIDTWVTHELEYHEFKGTGADNQSFRDKWEVMIQMFAATLDAERRHGKQVGSVYIHGLLKGKRGQAYNSFTGKYDQGPARQQSIFCYGYRKPAAPPVEREEWAAQYEWFDDFEQKTKRLGKAYQKTGVWELPDELVPPGMGKAEFWAKWIPAEVRRKQLILLGPFSRQELMVPRFLEECKGEEGRWREGLWQLYEMAQRILAEAYNCLPVQNVSLVLPEGVDPAAAWWETVWPDLRFQSLLDRLFPRSYECRRYGNNHSCGFEEICFGREGWSRPIESGRFINRRPHHADELNQMAERGLLPPEEGAGASAEEIQE